MKFARNSKKTHLRYVAVLLAIVFLVGAALLAINLWEQSRSTGWESDYDDKRTIAYNGQKYVLRDDVETFLFMGLDKYEMTGDEGDYNNDQQADFLLLLVMDRENETCSAIHINRDTMTEMDMLGVAGQSVGTVTKQVALAHTYGNGKEVSCRNTADAISNLLYGVKIDHYMSLTMEAVAILNDLVGGVEVTIAEDFAGVDENLIPGDTVRLKGEQALTYVRTRKGLEDSSNASRMLRQRQYIDALYQQMQQKMKTDEDFSVEAVLKISEHMVSNCSSGQLQKLLDTMSEYQFDGIVAFEGQNVKGEEFMEFYPDVDSVKKTVVELLCAPK